MGRHGGGSRSGGSRSSSSSRSRSSSSRSGGSSPRYYSSNKPKIGYYDRCYYTRAGKRVRYYTTDSSFGKTEPSMVSIITLIFLYLFFVVYALYCCVEVPKKVSGNLDNIYIIDKIDIFTSDEESELIDLAKDVYNKSGMPIAICTDDFSYKENYTSIEAYSEDLYYTKCSDEDSMIILYTEEYTSDTFKDWDFDIYCGDDTIDCLSGSKFDTLISKINTNIRSNNHSGYEGIKAGLNYLSSDIRKLDIPLSLLLVIVGTISLMFIPALISEIKKYKNCADAYNYFKENSSDLNKKISVLLECPSCGASNNGEKTHCEYCGRILKKEQ